ncbi:hypothetical protein KTE21_01190 [Burkholderia multivorans]|nr:hypothetical protein [Burkholderia multivorans]
MTPPELKVQVAIFMTVARVAARSGGVVPSVAFGSNDRRYRSAMRTGFGLAGHVSRTAGRPLSRTLTLQRKWLQRRWRPRSVFGYLSFGAPSSTTAATPTVQVQRLQPSQIIVEGTSRRIIPGGPGRYQWFTLMHSVLRNSRASWLVMSWEQPAACSRYDHPDEELSSLLPKLLKASEHRRRVAAIAASGAGYPATDEIAQRTSGHFKSSHYNQIRRSYALCKLTEHAMSFRCHAFDCGVTRYSAISD